MDLHSQQGIESALQDDAILPATRLVAAGVIPFLIAASIILYLLPGTTGERFAWEIGSPLTAALMGAGYLGGAYFFFRVLRERRWHRAGAGFPTVAVFTAVLLVTTLLHWDTFDPTHWPFLVWLVIYILTPVIVPAVWLQNRRRDPGTPEPHDQLLPASLLAAAGVAGLVLLATAALLFFVPALAVEYWPWPQTLLTARVMASWLALLGTGTLILSRERRWSAWRLPMQSILLWQVLLLVAFVIRREAFGAAGPLNWFTIFTVAGIVLAAVLYTLLERRYRRSLT